MNNKEAFSEFIYATNVEGSKKAASYIRAIDLLNDMLETEPFSFNDCKEVWSMNSIDRLQDLYLFVLAEAKKGNASAWNINGIPASYLQNGYCSAALKSYQTFLAEHNFEIELLTEFENHKGDESELVSKLEKNIVYPNFLLEDLDPIQGKEFLRLVSVRVNQYVFRKMIMSIYNHSCCITGLNIPAVNRASLIIPWAKDPSKRLDPRNGICLSATYDAAFDRNLISLDEHYRLIISKEISDHYKSDIVKEYFLNKEGEKIKLPSSYLPQKEYLAVHRGRGRF